MRQSSIWKKDIIGRKEWEEYIWFLERGISKGMGKEKRGKKRCDGR